MTMILGIDPGSRVTGFGLINSNGNKIDNVDYGCIRTSDSEMQTRLKTIFNDLCAVIHEYRPEEVAIEDVFMGRNAGSALKLGQARGVALAACLANDLYIHEYSARKVKQSVVGTGAATKAQVNRMVQILLGINENIAEDAADALAIAICHANTQSRLIRLSGAKSFSKKRLR